MYRILFVDDEPLVLNGLRRVLRHLRDRWDMHFAVGPDEALRQLDGVPFDVVVSDMRMPGMDGAELLQEVRRRQPGALRLVLSGHADGAGLAANSATVHQWLAKPCDETVLVQAIGRALQVGELLRDRRLRQMVAGSGTLPAVPALYSRVAEELAAPDGSLRGVGEIIAADMAMSAKVLQLANSAYYRPAEPVTDVVRAVGLLGGNLLRGLILLGHLADRFPHPLPGVDRNRLWQHSVQTALLARRIAEFEGMAVTARDEASLGGLLHDIGQLILSVHFRDRYAELVARAHACGRRVADAEQEAFGCTHAEVGGYLLASWGLPTAVVEAVAYHHRPRRGADGVLGPLHVVHLADGLLHEEEAADECAVDADLLRRFGLRGEAEQWHRLHAETVGRQWSPT